MASSNPAAPIFGDLTATEARAFLATQHVARIAYTFHDRVDIEPIHLVADDDWLYGRTQPGTKLSTLSHHPWCAVEFDEIRGTFDWISVVVHGACYIIAPEHQPDIYKLALRLLRTLVPQTLLQDDPAQHRTILFRIHISDISGKSAH